MRLAISLLIIALIPGILYAGQPDFDRFFAEGSLRIDLFHTGTADMEIYSLDEVIRERFWAGNPRALVDKTNMGGHIVRVYDLGTNTLIYSRGYCSLFGEWRTTDEAIEGFPRTFHESVIVPWPRGPVQVRIDRRNRENIFKNVFDIVVDPADYHIETDRRYRYFKVRKLLNNGPPGSKVDVVILGDGYRSDQMHKLRDDTNRLLEVFFDTEPFKSRKKDFNVNLIEVVSEHKGIDDPRKEIYRNNLLGCTFNTFDLDRYMLTTENKVMRDIAGNVPYDQIMIIANTEKYGGGGIFNLYMTCCSDNEFDGYVFTHEFGHSFGGLADEYYSSDVAYNEMYPRGIEPWEPNITAMLDSTDVKWEDMIPSGTPVPTPADSVWNGVVGCFEGAGYSAKGLYRSFHDCRMLTKGLVDFCPVCRMSIERMIDFYTK
jgi:hypothetical protein